MSVRPGLKIALVGPLPPPSGGMANQLRQLKRLLESEGLDVHVVQVNKPYSPRWIAELKGIRAVFRLFPYILELWKTAGKVKLFHVFANSGWSWHLFAAPAVWIAFLRKTPVVINYRGGEAESFFTRSFSWVKLSLNKAHSIIVPSKYLQHIFGKWDVPTLIVPNIIDINKFSAVQYRKERRYSEKFPNLLVSRNLEPLYDIGMALKATRVLLEHYPNVFLVVAGSGPEKDNLQRLAEELGILNHVEFTGRVDNDEMNRLYNSADVMLNTSLVDNMPNSVLEALACGVPVVSTDVGGIPYLVRNRETALLVPVNDEKAMAGSVLELLENENLKNRLIDQGQQLANQFSWSNVKEKLFEVYERALV